MQENATRNRRKRGRSQDNPLGGMAEILQEEGADGGGELSLRQRQAVLAVLTEPSLEAAAAKVGVSPATLWRWRQSSAFQHAVRNAQREAFDTALARITHAATAAVDALTRNLTCGTPAMEIAAAKAVLEHARAAIRQAEEADACWLLSAGSVGQEPCG